MAKTINTSESQGYILIWKDKGENDATKYELFKRLSVLYRKYGKDELHIAQGTLNNMISGNNDGSPMMYENADVRIIRTKLNDKSDFKPSEEEKALNQIKIQQAKERKAKKEAEAENK